MANKSKKDTTPRKMVSLFAGICGFELGFKKAGIEIVDIIKENINTTYMNTLM